MKKGLDSYTDYQVAAFRIFISFVAFIPLIIKNLKKLSKENVKSLLIVGFIGNAFPAILFAKGQTEISSSLAAMLNTLVPVFTLVIGVIFYKIKTNIVNIFGVLIGLIGAAVLIFYSSNGSFEGNYWYSVLIVVATMFYAINTNEVKSKLQNLSGVSVAALSFLMIGPFAGIYLIFSDFTKASESPDRLLNFGYICALALLSSFTAIIIFNVLIKHTTALFSASVTYIIPVFAIFWGILDNETVSLIQISSVVIIFLGIYLVNKKKGTQS
jgi:drug/metabolite transporter (DMT)-like permease